MQLKGNIDTLEYGQGIFPYLIVDGLVFSTKGFGCSPLSGKSNFQKGWMIDSEFPEEIKTALDTFKGIFWSELERRNLVPKYFPIALTDGERDGYPFVFEISKINISSPNWSLNPSNSITLRITSQHLPNAIESVIEINNLVKEDVENIFNLIDELL